MNRRHRRHAAPCGKRSAGGHCLRNVRHARVRQLHAACRPEVVRRNVRVTCLRPVSQQETVEYPVTRFEPNVQSREISYNVLEPRKETREEAVHGRGAAKENANPRSNGHAHGAGRGKGTISSDGSLSGADRSFGSPAPLGAADNHGSPGNSKLRRVRRVIDWARRGVFSPSPPAPLPKGEGSFEGAFT